MPMLMKLAAKLDAGKDDFGKPLVDLVFHYVGGWQQMLWAGVRADTCTDWNEGDEFEMPSPRKTVTRVED